MFQDLALIPLCMERKLANMSAACVPRKTRVCVSTDSEGMLCLSSHTCEKHLSFIPAPIPAGSGGCSCGNSDDFACATFGQRVLACGAQPGASLQHLGATIAFRQIIC